jgi:hypothetical protein
LKYFEKAGWSNDWIETARQIVQDEFDRTYAFMDIEVAEEEKENVRSYLFF